MPWTNPKTWVPGPPAVTAADLNTHVRDNLNGIFHPIARKTADESVTSSITLQDDNHLIVPVLANEVWQLTWYFVYKATTAGDMRFAFTFPTGATVNYTWAWLNAAGSFDTTGHVEATTSPSTTHDLHGIATEFEGPVPIDMLYVGGANAGNVTLQWAQNVSDATATIMKTNSTVWGAKLA